MGDDYEYVSYKSPKTIVAETVYHFFRGGLYGAAFGMVGTDDGSNNSNLAGFEGAKMNILFVFFFLVNNNYSIIIAKGHSFLRSWNKRRDSGSKNRYIQTSTYLRKLVQCSLKRINIRISISCTTIHMQVGGIFEG